MQKRVGKFLIIIYTGKPIGPTMWPPIFDAVIWFFTRFITTQLYLEFTENYCLCFKYAQYAATSKSGIFCFSFNFIRGNCWAL